VSFSQTQKGLVAIHSGEIQSKTFILSLLQLVILFAPATLWQVETLRLFVHFVHSAGQNVLFGGFKLNKSTLRHSTLPEGQGVLMDLKLQSTNMGPIPPLPDPWWNNKKKKKKVWLMQKVCRGQGWVEWFRGVKESSPSWWWRSAKSEIIRWEFAPSSMKLICTLQQVRLI